MALYYIFLYAIIQGITEFLPISSSGHLILAHEWVNGHENDGAESGTKWAEDAVIDIAVHVGTLFSVLLYFWRDFFSIARGALLSVFCKGSAASDETVRHGRNMALYLILASMPVIVAGFLLHQWQPEWLRSAEIVAWTTLIFAYVLWMADRFRPVKLETKDINAKSALIVGFAQVLALVPGTSRSGVTMTAARGLGFTREASAKFSLFLSTVAISGAGLLAGLDVFSRADVALGMNSLIAAAVSFVAGYISISVMIKWLKSHDFTPFVLYRAFLGLALLLIVYL